MQDPRGIRLKSISTTDIKNSSLANLSSFSDETPRQDSFNNNLTPDLTMHEGSSLLMPEEEEEETRSLASGCSFRQDELQDEFHQTKSLWYMILLTISIGGLQFAWSVELSNGTPYLISLGLNKSMMALIWIAGPLSGALVQPYVGMLSDNFRSSWGKRTPFIILGSIATIISLLALAWVRDIVTGFLGLFGISPASRQAKDGIIVVAVFLVYLLDFSINTVQAGIRAFILDCAPSHLQETANSMASRIIGIGNILGYVAGYIDLKHYLSYFGDTQFKILCVIASLALAATVLLSLSTIREANSCKETEIISDPVGITSFFRTIHTSFKHLPPLTYKVCRIQFFAWIGMFPQLFYSSSYISDIYVQPYLETNPHMTQPELDQLYEKGTRIGTFALLIYAIVSLATNLFLPFFVAPSYHNTTRTFFIPGFTLRVAWMISHLIFSACMFSTIFIRSISTATAIIGIVGIPWALSLWAPYAIISSEVSKLKKNRNENTTFCDGYEISDRTEQTEDQAGVILGIHNIFITTGQIVATVGSSIIFKFFQKPLGVPGDRSFSVVLAIGGFGTIIAAWFTSRMPDKTSLTNEENYDEEPGKNQP
ncbi:General alpha-glucoside permease [Golovinomyces cichoracearum]|uniref:General alpha-glucoside permease n=1 Tax=Golovinomyces cichoracearum TaxID=62708 RepID=A0A420IM43_9PEZI|nr:General alpha-glucoside permease [Golovinomyces cichoracearum]